MFSQDFTGELFVKEQGREEIKMKHMTGKTAISTMISVAMLAVSLMLSGCNVDPDQVAQLVGSMAQNPEKTQEIVQEAADAEKAETGASTDNAETAETGASTDNAGQSADAASQSEDADDTPSLPDRDIYILCTADIHCGVDQGFGYAGLKQILDSLRTRGCDVILVDDGDHVQGELIGTVSKGEAIMPIMNALGYEIAIPGNHEFDYGIDEFIKYTELADFPYISCNFTKNGEPVFAPYLIKEAGGKRFAFVGVTTPETLTSVSPKTFQDKDGNYVYGFMQGDGSQLYQAVQDAVDAAVAEGVDYVYLMAHVGNEEDSAPYNCMDIIANTTGIDVVLDGHSHDLDQMVLKNRDGKEIPRIACGYKFSGIGYSHIKAEDGSADTGIWVWENSESVPALFNIHNEVSDDISSAQAEIEEKTKQVIARTDVSLTINDPKQKDEKGVPVRMVRNRETNMGDFCADAVRIRTGADIGVVNGGGVRADIGKGDITYGDIISVHPFGNKNVVIEVTGRQIEDALEWSCRSVPDEEGGFLQVSGMSFKVDTSVKSGCTVDENGMMTGIKGERRVSDIMIGDKPLDPDSKYTVAGNEFILMRNGNGYSSFDGATVVVEDAGLDNQLLIDYIVEDLGGTISEDYSDPYGQGRIGIK